MPSLEANDGGSWLTFQKEVAFKSDRESRSTEISERMISTSEIQKLEPLCFAHSTRNESEEGYSSPKLVVVVQFTREVSKVLVVGGR